MIEHKQLSLAGHAWNNLSRGQATGNRHSAHGADLNQCQRRAAAQACVFVPPDIADMVPAGASTVLDVGCGVGTQGALLRQVRGLEVIGVDRDARALEIAGRRLTRVLAADIEKEDLPFQRESFDCLLLLHVLEYLADPRRVMIRLTRYLKPMGAVIVSVDGSRCATVSASLLADVGIELALTTAVCDPRALQPSVPDTGAAAPGAAPAHEWRIRALMTDGSGVLEWIWLGNLRRPLNAVDPLPGLPSRPEVSVVIPVFNNLTYTKRCLDSLSTVGDGTSFEVVVVNNGSRDGTKEYLDCLGPPVRALNLPVNLGFAKGCNAGARLAEADVLVFLNNDTIVLDGWLSRMLECLRSDTRIGIVGNLQIYPDSGRVQHAGIACGPDQILFNIYNGQLGADHPAVTKTREFQFVAGSCMMIRRELFFAIGGFDEAYRNSCEDVDLCMKARAVGGKVVCCGQSRILHFESKTVAGHDKNSGNYHRFLKRWGSHLKRDDHLYYKEDGFAERGDKQRGRKRKKVCLIAPPRYYKTSTLSGYTGFSKNLGLGYIAANLRAADIEVSIIDALALGINKFTPVDLPNGRVYRCGLSYQDIAAAIPKDTDCIGIGVPFSNVWPICLELTQELKSRLPHISVALGGVHPSVFPQECLESKADYVVRGEGERALVSLVRGDDPVSIPGLYWREAGEVRQGCSTHACIDDLDTLPFPAWDLMPMHLYLKVSQRGDRTRRSLSLITSRGCPFSCRFCSVHPVAGSKWRARSPENVIAEIRMARDLYHINHLEIEDDNFTLNKSRALQILTAIRDQFPDLTWAAHNGVRIDTLDEELLRAIKDSRCVQLNLAIEHGSKSVLQAMNKRLSLTKVREVVEICGRLKIPTLGFCLVGFPGETSEAFRESFEFFRQLKWLGLGGIAPFIVNAYPGTELYRASRENGWLDPRTDRHLFFLEDEFVSVTTEDFDQRTVRLRKLAMEMLNEHPRSPIRDYPKAVQTVLFSGQVGQSQPAFEATGPLHFALGSGEETKTMARADR